MSDPNQEIPHVPQEDPREIQEIVSPVQPTQPKTQWARNGVALAVSAVALFAAGYLLYGEWPALSGGIKVANAPITEDVPRTESVPVPAEEMLPEPRISSTATNTPTPVPAPAIASPTPSETPQVAGASTAVREEVYVHPTGFSLRRPVGSSISSGGDTSIVVAVYAQSGALLSRIEVADILLDTPQSLGDQLRLSPAIHNVAVIYQNNLSGYTYTVNGVPSTALIKGNRVYYITDYSGSILSSFGVQ